MFLTCIFAYVCMLLCTSHWLYMCTHRLHAAAVSTQACCTTSLPSRLSLPAMLSWFHLFATVWPEVTWQPVFQARAQFYDTFHIRLRWIKIDSAVSLGRDAEFGVRAVCAVGDTTGEDRWVDLLCFSPHCDTMSCVMNNTLTTSSSSPDCYDDWRRASPTICHPSYDASSPFCRYRLLRCCHDTSAAQHLLLVSSYFCWVTFSVSYYVIDYFSLYTC